MVILSLPLRAQARRGLPSPPLRKFAAKARSPRGSRVGAAFGKSPRLHSGTPLSASPPLAPRPPPPLFIIPYHQYQSPLRFRACHPSGRSFRSWLHSSALGVRLSLRSKRTPSASSLRPSLFSLPCGGQPENRAHPPP